MTAVQTRRSSRFPPRTRAGRTSRISATSPSSPARRSSTSSSTTKTSSPASGSRPRAGATQPKRKQSSLRAWRSSRSKSTEGSTSSPGLDKLDPLTRTGSTRGRFLQADALVAEELHRVSGGAPVAHLEVQVASGGSSGGPDTCDDLANGHVLAVADADSAAHDVGVRGGEAIAVVDLDEVAVTAVPARVDDPAAGCSVDRRIAARAEIGSHVPGRRTLGRGNAGSVRTRRAST